MVLLANPGLPLWPYVVCAALTGLGGGNYAASLANVNAFYPQRLKGAALAINAGVGNLGVAVIQLVGLLVLATHPLGGTKRRTGSARSTWCCWRSSASPRRCSWTTSTTASR
jgi:nitrate/nitrite transporter NarK